MSQTIEATDQQEIRQLIDRFTDAWNRHDVRSFATTFAEDADFTNVIGLSASTRPKIEELHAPLFATIFKSSSLTCTDVRIRLIRPDVAAVDVPWEMTGATDPQGNPWPARKGLLNFVLTKDTGPWLILVMHNMDFAAPPPPPK